MNKLGITLAAWLTTITIGMPLALQPVFMQADQTIQYSGQEENDV